MTQARFYETNGINIQELAGAGADFFRRDNFDSTFYNDYNGRTVLQIGKQQGARFLVGLAYSLTVVFTPQPDGKVLVELGGESWGDKIASGAIGAVLLPPLLFTAAYGAWQQSELDNRFWAFLDGYIFNRSGRPANTLTAVPYYNAPSQWPATPSPAPGYQTYQNQAYHYGPPGQSQPPYPAPMSGPSRRANWFDPSSMQPVFERQVGRMASWQIVMADGVIDYKELNAQQERVDKLQKRAEEMLENDSNLDGKLKLAETMTELGKLEQMQRSLMTKAV